VKALRIHEGARREAKDATSWYATRSLAVARKFRDELLPDLPRPLDRHFNIQSICMEREEFCSKDFHISSCISTGAMRFLLLWLLMPSRGRDIGHRGFESFIGLRSGAAMEFGNWNHTVFVLSVHANGRPQSED
jgi:hypothetical protein